MCFVLRKVCQVVKGNLNIEEKSMCWVTAADGGGRDGETNRGTSGDGSVASEKKLPTLRPINKRRDLCIFFAITVIAAHMTLLRVYMLADLVYRLMLP